MSLVAAGTASFLFYFLFGYLHGDENPVLATGIYFVLFAVFGFFFLFRTE